MHLLYRLLLVRGMLLLVVAAVAALLTLTRVLAQKAPLLLPARLLLLPRLVRGRPLWHRPIERLARPAVREHPIRHLVRSATHLRTQPRAPATPLLLLQVLRSPTPFRLLGLVNVLPPP